MAHHEATIRVDKRSVAFPMENAGSVHLMRHTLLKLIPKLRLQTGKQVKGQIIRNKIVIFNA